MGHSLATGDYAAGLRHVDRLLRLDNLSERAHRDKMLLLARQGQMNAALQQYNTLRQLLADELDVSPTAESTQLVERIRAARANPGLKLPPPVSPFIGRDQELADLQRRLAAPDCRLLTVLGPGGMGKTRLALAAAGTIAQNRPGLFLNGIRFAPLADLSGPALLPAAIADACGLTFQGQADPLTQLVDFLRPQEMLLVLDNFEHLFGPRLGPKDGVDMLITILQEAPLVKILATSRARLQLQEEWVFDLAGLDYPETAVSANWRQYSAIRLFHQQAARLQREFTLRPDDIQAMADICRLLEGQPLGIELAAAWVRELPCPEIAQRLKADIDFLASTLRNAPLRHRSLTAVFDHSWRLLSPAEQAVFARLSIFQGDFSAEAAEMVAGAVQDDLTQLAAKSLLKTGENGRYTIHALLRQYAAQRLAALPDAPEETGRRHAAFFLDLVSRQKSGETAAERETIQIDLPNIRAAWDWAARHQDGRALLTAAPKLHSFYSVQSWFQEGIQAFQFALDQLRDQSVKGADQAGIFCDLLSRKARLHIHIGQLDAARQALDDAMTYLPHVENPERHAAILGYVAITNFYAGDFERAAALAAESLRLAEQANDLPGAAFAHNFLGSCGKALGDYESSSRHFTLAVETYRRLDDRLGEAMAVHNLGNLAQASGDFAAAQAHYLACSEMFKALNHTHGAATTLANAGRLSLKQGNFDEARDLLTESLTLKRQQQDDRGTAVALVGLGGVSVAVGETARAQQELVEAVELAQRTGDVKLTLEALNGFAALSLALNKPERARQLLAFILSRKETAQEVRDGAEALLPQVSAALSPAAEKQAVTTGEMLDLTTAVSLVLAEKRG